MKPTKASTLSVLVACSLSSGCDPNADEPKPDPDKGGDLMVEACSAEMLVGGQVIASQKFVRSKGAPVTQSLEFSLLGDLDVCVVIATGTVDSKGDLIDPAPSSMVVSLDQSGELADPSVFNAHPQLVSRLLPADEISAGTHTLTVELRGKPTSVAYVTVVAAPAGASGTSISGPGLDRLEDPSGYDTVVRDEAIALVNDGISPDDLTKILEGLPFPAIVIGRLPVAPIYQIYLPGAEGGVGLSERIAKIAELPQVEMAGPHRVGRAVPNVLYPRPGHDSAYVNAAGTGFSLGGKHLDTIHADKAWATCNVRTSADVLVLDNGFDPSQPGLKSNVKSCSSPGNSVDCINDPETLAPSLVTCKPGDAKCKAWQACLGGQGYESHGQAVAGLIAAVGDTKLGPNDTVGVVWSGLASEDPQKYEGMLHLARIEEYTTGGRVSDPQLMDLVDTMSGIGVNIINLTYGSVFLCADKSLSPTFDSVDDAVEAFEERRAEDAKYWGKILSVHKDLVVVASAGNSGDRCKDDYAKLCSTLATGYACAVEGPLAKQVLCVAASTLNGDEFAAFSNHSGDRIAAPGESIDVMTISGGVDVDQGGTSFAAPLVAGAVSFARGINPTLTPAQIHDILVNPPDKPYRLLSLDYLRQKACSEGAFSDVPKDHWAFAAINTLTCECVLEGYEDGGDKHYSPEKTINRVEALKIILELAFPLNPFDPPGDKPYVDVEASAWYATYVAFAKNHGMLDKVIGNGTEFAPATEVTRGEFMYLLVMAATQSSEPEFVALAKTYSKIETLPHEVYYLDLPIKGVCPDMMGNAPCHVYHDEIYSGTDQCVVAGYPDKSFGPDKLLNRAEAAKIACIATYGYGDSERCGEFPPCTPNVP